MVRLCLAMSLVSFACCLPLCWWLIGFSRRRGQLDQPGAEEHKAHHRAVANTGGIAIFWAVVAPMALALAGVWLLGGDTWSNWIAPLAAHLDGLKTRTPAALALIGAMVVLHVTGLIDDRRGLSATVKLLVQFVVALVLAGPLQIRVMQFLESYGQLGVGASTLISVLWIVAIINAMNMMDNMDGLAGGVGLIIAGFYLAATLIAGQWFVAALCALLCGALVGFLVFNRPPARLFMGDAGSLVIGLLLAVISIRTTYYVSPSPNGTALPTIASGAAWYATLMPLVIMAVPLYDLVSVCLIRLAHGRSPFVGDRNHLSHRLVRRGMSQPTAVGLIHLLTMATAMGGIMFATLTAWQAVLVAAQTVLILTVLAVLEFAG